MRGVDEALKPNAGNTTECTRRWAAFSFALDKITKTKEKKQKQKSNVRRKKGTMKRELLSKLNFRNGKTKRHITGVH